MANSEQPTVELKLYVYNRGYQCACFVYEGPRPAWPYVLKYKRGETRRHSSKEQQLERGHGADYYDPLWFKAECRPHELAEWQTMVLPQNGFTLK